jgi:hypothetical protein
MGYWFEGWHFSNMEKEQCSQVVAALMALLQEDNAWDIISQGVQEPSEQIQKAREQKLLNTPSEKSKTNSKHHTKDNKATISIENPNYWKKELAHILYGKGSTLLDTKESKKLQDRKKCYYATTANNNYYYNYEYKLKYKYI